MVQLSHYNDEETESQRREGTEKNENGNPPDQCAKLSVRAGQSTLVSDSGDPARTKNLPV